MDPGDHNGSRFVNFNTTLIISFFEILVIGCGLWLLFSCFTYVRTLPSPLKTRVYLAMGGIALISSAFFLHFSFNMLITASNAPKMSLAGFVSWIGISLGCICVSLALYNMIRATATGEEAPLVFFGDHKDQQKSIEFSAENHDLKKFKAVFHNNPAPLVVIDTNQRISRVNTAFADLLKHPVSTLEGQELSGLVAEDDRHQLQELVAQKIIARQDRHTFDLRLVDPTGTPVWVRVSPQLIELEKNQDYILLMMQDISENKNLSEMLAFHSQYDALTMLHNRSGLENYLTKALEKCNPTEQRIALIYIDIDQIKVVNDTCGHAAGDSLLQHLVTKIAHASEQCHLFARIGGDEFALVKLDSDEEEAKNIAESVRSAAEDFTFVWNDNSYRQSISVGVALTSSTINNVVDLIGAADAACCAAKDGGKNRVVVYSESIDDTRNNRRDMMWVSRLQKAIQDGDFELYFQPIEKLDSSKAQHVHYELLIRYVDASGQHVKPHFFLPAVERFGFSEQVDLWVITTALDFLDKHPEHTAMLDCCSINLTSQSIANHRIRSAILQVVQSYDFPSEKICFEITESSAIRNLREAQEFVSELKTLGCHLALDDFGTGFSSFGYLKNLAVDYIKIDGSFVKDIINDRFDRAMVSAINNIGKEMGISIVAEYAESLSILRALEKMEVDFAQGDGIAQPMPISELESYYHRS